MSRATPVATATVPAAPQIPPPPVRPPEHAARSVHKAWSEQMAAWTWEHNPEERGQFSTKERFVAFTAANLRGQQRVSVAVVEPTRVRRPSAPPPPPQKVVETRTLAAAKRDNPAAFPKRPTLAEADAEFLRRWKALHPFEREKPGRAAELKREVYAELNPLNALRY